MGDLRRRVVHADGRVAVPLEPYAIDVLAATPRVIDGLIRDLPSEIVEAPGDGGWSAKDVLAHVMSIQRPALTERLRLIFDEDRPAVPDVDEDEALRDSGLRVRPAIELLDTFARTRADAIAWLRTIERSAFDRIGIHEVAGELTAAHVTNHLAYHDLAHIAQIARLLYGPVEAGRGPMRGSFPDAG